MKYTFLLLFTIIIFSCENNSFDSDKRQLIAKDEIRGKLKVIKKELEESGKIETIKVLTERGYFNDSRKNLVKTDKNLFNERQELGIGTLFFKNTHPNCNNNINYDFKDKNNKI